MIEEGEGCTYTRVYVQPMCTGKRHQRTVLSLRVYNMSTVSTMGRPRLLVVHSVYRLIPGKRACAQCLQPMHIDHRPYMYA